MVYEKERKTVNMEMLEIVKKQNFSLDLKEVLDEALKCHLIREDQVVFFNSLDVEDIREKVYIFKDLLKQRLSLYCELLLNHLLYRDQSLFETKKDVVSSFGWICGCMGNNYELKKYKKGKYFVIQDFNGGLIGKVSIETKEIIIQKIDKYIKLKLDFNDKWDWEQALNNNRAVNFIETQIDKILNHYRKIIGDIYKKFKDFYEDYCLKRR